SGINARVLFLFLFVFSPHGTCPLSVSWPYFSLRWSLPPASGCTLKQPDSKARSRSPERCDGLYWPGTICGPWPRSRETWTVTCAPATRPARTPQLPYVPRHKSARRDSAMGFSLFARRYWGNHGCFLFLRLLICLNPAGSPA
ncbi:hypothetical protein H477_5704, partial [[Clostridium] sordellii ATCC 9714]